MLLQVYIEVTIRNEQLLRQLLGCQKRECISIYALVHKLSSVDTILKDSIVRTYVNLLCIYLYNWYIHKKYEELIMVSYQFKMNMTEEIIQKQNEIFFTMSALFSLCKWTLFVFKFLLVSIFYTQM